MEKHILVPGQRFGLLTVLEEAPRHKGRRCWLCRCDCGAEKTVDHYHLLEAYYAAKNAEDPDPR